MRTVLSNKISTPIISSQTTALLIEKTITVTGAFGCFLGYFPTIRNSPTLSMGWATATTVSAAILASDVYLSVVTENRDRKKLAEIAGNSILFTSLIGCGFGTIPLLSDSITQTTIATALLAIATTGMTFLSLLSLDQDKNSQ